MTLHDRTPEDQWKTQPKMPSDRPPTKEEVWAWTVHMYGGIFEFPKLKQMAQSSWAWQYIHWVNFDGWRKQPDWVPGDPLVSDAIPVGPITVTDAYFPFVNKLWAIAQDALCKEAA